MFSILKTTDLIHNINSPTLFRCEYRSPDKFLSRNIRFKVEIIEENINKPSSQIDNKQQNIQAYKILFTLMTGSSRQFQQICKHICQLVSSHNYLSIQQRNLRQQQQKQVQLQAQQQQQSQLQSSNNNTNIISNSINHVLQQQQQPTQLTFNNNNNNNTPMSRRNSNVSSNTNCTLNTPSPSTSSSTSSTSSTGSTNASPMIHLQQHTSPLPIITNIESSNNTNNSINNVNKARISSNSTLNSSNINSNNFLFHNQYQQLQQKNSYQIPQGIHLL